MHHLLSRLRRKIALFITFIVVLQLYVLIVTTSSIDIVPQINLESKVDYLRGNDDRLVRFNVPDEDSKARQNEICTDHFIETIMNMIHNLTSLLHSVSLSQTYQQIGLCLQLLTLCATNHDVNRHHIGEYKNGETITNIVKLIEHPFLFRMETITTPQSDIINLLDLATRTSAYASEATWILSFNSFNHDRFVDNHCVTALRRVIVSTQELPSIHVAKMWALAALQNLAASYCESPSGHCRWYYDKDTDKATLHPKTPLSIDGRKAREFIVHDSELVQSITTLACHPPSSSSTHSDDHPWPTRATRSASHHELHDNMPTWAAAGAIKNLILSREIWPKIMSSKECLCDLKYSADWLESEKAQDALSRMGLSRSCMAPWYKKCQDMTVSDQQEWMNSFQETCTMYRQNQWCDEYGHLKNDEGVSANEACCACGGGVHKSSTASDEF